jgi:hypothetical protein
MNKITEISLMVLLETIVSTIIFIIYNVATKKKDENFVKFFIINYILTLILFLVYHYAFGIKLYGDFI